jgi:S-(hydroxymethyl)glutathione dehydrogenase/alcohol dehydrogenase
MIIGVDINPGRKALAEKFGMTHFVNPKEVEGDLVGLSGQPDQGRRRLQLRVRRQRHAHAPGAGVLPQGLGRLGDHRRGRRGPGDLHAAVPAGDRPGLEGHGLRRRARRTDVPKIVDWYMDGKINIDDLITHVMPLEKINEAFDLMHEGKSIRSVVTF